jgi:crotonobetainyl-CoA:carnitine CoA-transferase CaiB-like acyl-CoA transferase
VAAALFRRAMTGQGAVVDSSLLASALWSNASDVLFSAVGQRDFSTVQMGSPFYETADGRHVAFNAVNENVPWDDLFSRIGRPDLGDDERFATPQGRAQHRAELTDEIGAAFRTETLDTWRERMSGFKGPYAPVNNLLEVSSDAQVVANDFVTTARADDGLEVPLVRAPVQIDEHKPPLGRAPRLGQHTREVLRELGYESAEIDAMINSNIARADDRDSEQLWSDHTRYEI